MTDEIIAFIPVRGGSKSIPGKNIKLLGSRPLVCHVIDAAINVAMIDRVIISTDDPEIKETVIHCYGGSGKISFHDRSKASATDLASTEDVMLEFSKDYHYKHIILIQATSPLLRSVDLEKGLEKYFSEKLGGLLSVVRQKRFLWDQHKPLNYNPNTRPRRQDFEGFFVENGAFYITSKENLLDSGCRISEPYGVYEMPSYAYHEIDEPEDWQVVESLLGSGVISDG